ncbi:hypothetical protein [Paenibacillus sp. SN-8-1]|uniref:hypothetical protein n=1 Tax=Paenibacillus sp. SN-8-1 TaxID=3435409 RepID=UPI003D9A1E8E
MSRDWQKDMSMCKEATESPDMCIGDTEVFSEYVEVGGEQVLIGRFNKTEDALFFCEAHEALPYWLQKYAAEKARADKLSEAINKAISRLRQGDLIEGGVILREALYPLPEREKDSLPTED